eukprot:CAMPEP_0195130980 /NCGR_PEP_ID=MMETSP0448-20130528/144193_1 /TAXON_ID=66468 /ORGANISM="Heterocapsa triquestra, Strain CCMP 448" /LENGTH=91 /DNA_ID=CAMNT_0040168913 /DNA_START=64 /DNA_END=335 /DNA_ORIENTATION=-
MAMKRAAGGWGMRRMAVIVLLMVACLLLFLAGTLTNGGGRGRNTMDVQMVDSNEEAEALAAVAAMNLKRVASAPLRSTAASLADRVPSLAA